MVAASQEWVTEKGVAIFSEDEEFTPDVLQQICDNNNARIADTGDLCPIVIGHTKRGLPETEQPPIVGYACNFRVGVVGKNKRKAILADFKLRKDRYEETKNYPRRSVEIWEKQMEIDPIALLGATTPKKDLGLLFAKNEGSRIRYYRDTYQEGQSMNEEVVKQVLDTLTNSAEWQWLKEQVAKGGKEDMSQEEDNKPDGDGVVDTPDEKPEPDKEPEKACETPEALKHQRDQAARELARFQQTAEQQTKQIDELQRKFRRAEREKDLLNLEMQGYRFSMAEELDEVQDLEPEKYSRYLAKLKKHYQRGPAGLRLNVESISDSGSEPTFDRSKMEQAMSLVHTGAAKDYAEAIKLVKKGA